MVVAREGRVLVTGYNGAPAGMPHCEHYCDCGAESILIKVAHQDWCNSLHPCNLAVHAEANAIAWAARVGARLDGAEMFSTLTACLRCAQLIINAGIIRFVGAANYRLTDGLELLKSAGIALE